MEGNSLGVSSRRTYNQSAIDKNKKKKKRKKKLKEGKRSSASSASASGSPDSAGNFAPKPQASWSCPSMINNTNQPNKNSSMKTDLFSKVNECLRWPAHGTYSENSFRSEVIGKFPVAGETEEEENERIAIYKMNRRKRYLAAQQALINKYPDVSVYASSSGSSSGRETHEERRRISSSRSTAPVGESKPVFHSANASPDPAARETQENIHTKYFSNADVALALSKGKNSIKTTSNQNILSAI